MNRAIVGLDVGSTTVKAVVVDSGDGAIVWSDYQRHQAEGAFSPSSCALRPSSAAQTRVFTTGSGARPLAAPLGASCKRSTPSRSPSSAPSGRRERRRAGRSGRQDYHLQGEREDRGRRAIASMNDKCASGTGATIDKCIIKVGMAAEQIEPPSLGTLPSSTGWPPSAASSRRPISSIS